MIKRVCIGIVVVVAFAGCQKWYQVPEPSYIEIDTYTTKVTPSQGTSNQNFTDMSVIANGTTYGIFPVGTKIPVLISGDAEFLIKGVIEVNGVSALRASYEVMKGCDSIIPVQLGKVTHIVPVFEYFSNTSFPWVLNFDGAFQQGPSLRPSCLCTTDTTVKLVTPGMGGGYCLKMAPNSVQTTCEVQTDPTKPIYLPSGGVGVYMEFNYLCNVPMNISIQGIPAGGTPTALTSCGGVYPSPVWAKTYIQLTEQVSTLQSGYYYIYLTALYDAVAGTNNYVYIDNIKIVVAE